MGRGGCKTRSQKQKSQNSLRMVLQGPALPRIRAPCARTCRHRVRANSAQGAPGLSQYVCPCMCECICVSVCVCVSVWWEGSRDSPRASPCRLRWVEGGKQGDPTGAQGRCSGLWLLAGGSGLGWGGGNDAWQAPAASPAPLALPGWVRVVLVQQWVRQTSLGT